jgi:hypothetical protein
MAALAATTIASASTIALAASGAGGNDDSGRQASMRTHPSSHHLSRAASLLRAEALLAEVSLPSGAQREAGEPSGAKGQLARRGGSRPASPLVVSAHAFWVVPSSSHAVFEWALSHKPAGTDSSGHTVGPSSLEEVFYGRNFRSGALLGSAVTIAVAASTQGPAYVRVEAYVVPRAMRPADERIPATARWLQITAVGALARHGHKPSPPPITIERPAEVRKIARMIDALPRAQPGVYSCPMDNGSSVSFTFRAAATDPVLAAVHAEATGCGSVSVKIDGRKYPGLSDGTELIHEVEKLLGPRAGQLPHPL